MTNEYYIWITYRPDITFTVHSSSAINALKSIRDKLFVNDLVSVRTSVREDLILLFQTRREDFYKIGSYRMV